MEAVAKDVISGRFAAVGLQLVLTVAVLRASGSFVARGMPLDCDATIVACPSGSSGVCAASGAATAACRQQLADLESAFLVELRVALGFLVAELVVLLSGAHSPHNEAGNFFAALLHAGGCTAVAMFLLSGSSCRVYHAVFALGSVLPFLCELCAWATTLRGARPLPRFPPPVPAGAATVGGAADAAGARRRPSTTAAGTASPEPSPR
eukprot:TRINITY_DN58006_c0_g1_i1.p1 TRINITY_DN58006_c0_g1~~TRINITY_DN58006_c0_g1_i1.p1  ORF type:complete len:208 (+),score=48.03 TRINITY_DN58006_c0_g1_i1:226-849(+)